MLGCLTPSLAIFQPYHGVHFLIEYIKIIAI